jgi:hypothetical protein
VLGVGDIVRGTRPVEKREQKANLSQNCNKTPKRISTFGVKDHSGETAEDVTEKQKRHRSEQAENRKTIMTDQAG